MDAEPQLITHGSAEYEMAVALRRAVLRKPLGLDFTPEELAEEKDQLHLAVIESGTVIGGAILKPLREGVFKLRQMVVHPAVQASGLGLRIVAYAEQLAERHGGTRMTMAARESAVGFYLKCGYRVVGTRFEEVTIPHVTMEKELKAFFPGTR